MWSKFKKFENELDMCDVKSKNRLSLNLPHKSTIINKLGTTPVHTYPLYKRTNMHMYVQQQIESALFAM